MTSGLVFVGSTATVGDAVAALGSAAGHPDQPAGVVVVDQEGHLLADVTVFELLGVDPERPIAETVGPPWPVTVPPRAGLRGVVSTMTDNRGSSILIVDDQERPVGRILADDVIRCVVPRVISVPAAAVLVSVLVLRGGFRRVDRVLLGLSAVFIAYVGAGVLSGSGLGRRPARAGGAHVADQQRRDPGLHRDPWAPPSPPGVWHSSSPIRWTRNSARTTWGCSALMSSPGPCSPG